VKTEIKRGGEISGNTGTYGLPSHAQVDQFAGVSEHIRTFWFFKGGFY